MKENLQFTALLDILSRQDLITEYSEDCKDITPSHITINSKDVVPGTFFVCKGASFKEDYLKSAIAQGAIVYLSQQKYDDVDIPYIIVNDIRKAMALAARWFFGNPGDNMTKVGITGTKGKTTVTFVMKDILDKYTDNRCSAF